MNDRSHHPIAEGLFSADGDGSPRLIASTCRACRTTTFPKQASCPRCAGEDVELELIGPDGTLWTWTVQTFPPKPPFLAPDNFEPFGVGYVEISGKLRVEARLTESDPDKLHIGMPMRLAIIPVPGHEMSLTFAFAPAGADV